MKQYIITEKTAAIVGIDIHHTKIIEDTQEFIVPLSWYKIMNNSCLYYGSSFQGRIEGSRDILKKDYKVPILICEHIPIIFFSVGKQTQGECIWISLKKLLYYTVEDKKIQFHFSKNFSVYTVASKESFENQLLKAYNLEKSVFQRCKN